MSVRVGLVPASIAISYQAIFRARVAKPTRAVEPSDKANADRQDSPNRNENMSAADKKASPPDKPPGKDLTVTPQALFDAALIAAEFKDAEDISEQDQKAELIRQYDAENLDDAENLTEQHTKADQ